MTEVTKEQFYNIITEQKLDVRPHSRRDFTDIIRITDWHNRDGSVYGKTEEHTTLRGFAFVGV